MSCICAAFRNGSLLCAKLLTLRASAVPAQHMVVAGTVRYGYMDAGIPVPPEASFLFLSRVYFSFSLLCLRVVFLAPRHLIRPGPEVDQTSVPSLGTLYSVNGRL